MLSMKPNGAVKNDNTRLVEQWAVKRWTSFLKGRVRVVLHSNLNVDASCSLNSEDGVLVIALVDGVLYQVSPSTEFFIDVQIGTTVDFAISPGFDSNSVGDDAFVSVVLYQGFFQKQNKTKENIAFLFFCLF